MNFANTDELRAAERASIRDFMRRHAALLRGRVLDFGAGTQPYKELVTGEYVPFEKGESFPAGSFGAVMCNQVFEYLEDPQGTVDLFYHILADGGHLVVTYPTNWYECEATDLWRFTHWGMERMLRLSGFALVTHVPRETHDPLNLVFGYGIVGRK
jgi:SAM-dependent methyltransferase